jgi:hypothetical protein
VGGAETHALAAWAKIDTGLARNRLVLLFTLAIASLVAFRRKFKYADYGFRVVRDGLNEGKLASTRFAHHSWKLR